jgi:hypothetical protein
MLLILQSLPTKVAARITGEYCPEAPFVVDVLALCGTAHARTVAPALARG